MKNSQGSSSSIKREEICFALISFNVFIHLFSNANKNLLTNKHKLEVSIEFVL